jgi:hypothetical protein
MIEHSPWIGCHYKDGINGQRIAIIGYSHWLGDGDEDSTEATIVCIRSVMSGEWKIRFFTQVRNYFGFDGHRVFWPHVMFFNYLPCCVGNADGRYDHGTNEQRAVAATRLLTLLREHLPDKVFIFSGRYWAFPLTTGLCQKLGACYSNFCFGTYGAGTRHIPVFFLRHPQGANGDLMRRAVRHILDRPT